MKDRIPSIREMTRELAIDADTVSTYQLNEGYQAGMTVVEAVNAHQQVIARTITDADGTREAVADVTLAGTTIERCSNWAVHPIGNGRRSTAMVSISMSSTTGTLDAMRARHGAVA